MSGIIMGAMGGMGEQAASIGSTMMKSELDLQNKTALQGQESDLALQRAKTMEAFKQEIANAPLQRFQGIVSKNAATEVPVAAAPVSQLTGAGTPIPDDGSAPVTKGFQGDPKAALAQVQAMAPGPDRDRALQQLRTQFGADSDANAAAVAGKTRKRTSSEAFNAALDDAMTSDVQAYAAAKPLAKDKFTTVADGATLLDEKGNVVFSSAGAKETREAARDDRRDARATEAEDRRDARALQSQLAAEARAQISADGKVPRGYRWNADQTELEYIPGGPADPKNKNKALPASTAKGLLDNQDNLRRAQRALALSQGATVDGMTGDPEATGAKGWLPNQVLNRIDKDGVDTRAAIADLGSMVVHERSGAAVTASEFPRLAPFIPTEKDDASTVKKKLGLFVLNYQALIDDQKNFYSESGYHVPTQVLRGGGGATGSWGGGASPASATAASAPSGWSIRPVQR